MAFVHTSNHDFSGRPPSAVQVARRAIGINVVAGRAAGLAETNWNRHVALRSKPCFRCRYGVQLTDCMQSFKNCLSFLHNSETPSLIRATIPASVQLTTMTTPPASSTRFDQLCSLLGDGIIGNIWVYASRDPDTLQASIDVIPEIVRALDIGTTRYLKVIQHRSLLTSR